jgi:hypothetical protein
VEAADENAAGAVRHDCGHIEYRRVRLPSSTRPCASLTGGPTPRRRRSEAMMRASRQGRHPRIELAGGGPVGAQESQGRSRRTSAPGRSPRTCAHAPRPECEPRVAPYRPPSIVFHVIRASAAVTGRTREGSTASRMAWRPTCRNSARWPEPEAVPRFEPVRSVSRTSDPRRRWKTANKESRRARPTDPLPRIVPSIVAVPGIGDP